MKIVLQRVKEAKVSIEEEVIGEIGKGYLVLLGVEKGDGQEVIKNMAEKVSKLRVMSGDEKDMDKSLHDVGGAVLIVPQFTLCADTSKGNRPSFLGAAKPDRAKELYKLFVEEVRDSGLEVETGRFGAYMGVGLINDGPVTIILE